MERLTIWNGRDEDGARAELADRTSPYHAAVQTALRKLARYEDTGLEPGEIKHTPAADVRPVVLCRDCKYSCKYSYYDRVGGLFCSHGICEDSIVREDDFCSCGEKREES